MKRTNPVHTTKTKRAGISTSPARLASLKLRRSSKNDIVLKLIVDVRKYFEDKYNIVKERMG